MNSIATANSISYYVKVHPNHVLQMEVHVLVQQGEKKHWLTKQHVQEVESLLLDVMRNRVSEKLEKRSHGRRRRKWMDKAPQVNKKLCEAFTQPEILTGESLRMAYSFKNKTLPQRYLMLRSIKKGYTGLEIFDEKLVVYIYHLEGYRGVQHGLVGHQVNQQFQTAAVDKQSGISSYFEGSKQAENSQQHDILKNMVQNKTKNVKHQRRKNTGKKQEVTDTSVPQLLKEQTENMQNIEILDKTSKSQNHHNKRKVESCQHDIFQDDQRHSDNNSAVSTNDQSTSAALGSCMVTSNDNNLELSSKGKLKGISTSAKKHRRRQLKYDERETEEINGESGNHDNMKSKKLNQFRNEAKKEVSHCFRSLLNKKSTVTKSSNSVNRSEVIRSIDMNDEHNYVTEDPSSKKSPVASDGDPSDLGSCKFNDHTDIFSKTFTSPKRCNIKLNLGNAKHLVMDSDGYGVRSKSAQIHHDILDINPQNPVEEIKKSKVDGIMNGIITLQGNKSKNKKMKKIKLLDSLLDDFSDTDVDNVNNHDKSTTSKNLKTPGKSRESKDVRFENQSSLVTNIGKPKKVFNFKYRLKLGKRKLNSVEEAESNASCTNEDNPTLDVPLASRCREKKSKFCSELDEEKCQDVCTDILQPGCSQSKKRKPSSTSRICQSVAQPMSNQCSNEANRPLMDPQSPELPHLSQYLRYSISDDHLHAPSTTITNVEVEDIFSECFIQEDLSDPITIKIEDCEAAKMEEDIKQIKTISELTFDHLSYLISSNERCLRNIFQGKVHNRRHQDYKSGMQKRVKLVWQIPLGLYKETQVEQILHALQNMFCKKHAKYLDYVLKVMFPELLIKIYMDLFHVDHEAAEDEMTNASYQSETQSHTDSSS